MSSETAVAYASEISYVSSVCCTWHSFVLDVGNCMQSSNGPAGIADGLLHEVHIWISFVLLVLQILILCSTWIESRSYLVKAASQSWSCTG